LFPPSPPHLRDCYESWSDSGFEEAEEHSGDEKAWEVIRSGHAAEYDTPAEHQACEEFSEREFDETDSDDWLRDKLCKIHHAPGV
jgi:hypothetical protein